jgi:uncharacterized protein YjiS (DUF1127 family)
MRKMMNRLIENLFTAVKNEAAYRRIRDEIAQMPRSQALDMGVYPEDAEQIASRAVWG